MRRALWNLALMGLSKTGYLTSTGWWESQRAGKPVDADGKPIPWITYGALAFLAPRLRSEMAVFEFGSGSSTLWWAERVQRVVSCEHDRPWFESLQSVVPGNVELLFKAREQGAYAKAASGLAGQFDVIVIDGRDRVQCAEHSVESLKPGGVFVWDNTDRAQYRPGFEFLATRGFRALDFKGAAPLVSFECSTSVFYRDHNCLGI